MNFVFSSWLRSLEDFQKHSGKSFDFVKERNRINSLASHAIVLAAVDPDDHDEIYGWVAYEFVPEPTVHYAYVKAAMRRLGVARALLRCALPDGKAISTATGKHADKLAARFSSC
jgi:GNAT superfamily N-acetyltransferase